MRATLIEPHRVLPGHRPVWSSPPRSTRSGSPPRYDPDSSAWLLARQTSYKAVLPGPFWMRACRYGAAPRENLLRPWARRREQKLGDFERMKHYGSALRKVCDFRKVVLVMRRLTMRGHCRI